MTPAHCGQLLQATNQKPEDQAPPPDQAPPLAAAAPKFPAELNEKALAVELGRRLAGKPAAPVNQVVWVDGGSEVLVHLDSLGVRMVSGTLLVSIDLETDQTGRAALVVQFALGAPNDPAGLLAVTDELPRGNGVLAARWGAATQAAVWSALLALIADFSAERGVAPNAFGIAGNTIQLRAGPPLVVRSAVEDGTP